MDESKWQGCDCARCQSGDEEWAEYSLGLVRERELLRKHFAPTNPLMASDPIREGGPRFGPRGKRLSPTPTRAEWRKDRFWATIEGVFMGVVISALTMALLALYSLL
jgi:hypothetical protein